ncbi:sugar phosphate isomerase/epimerase [Paenibacillus sp. J2TS4]|uniref:sugar phosphate isomerase/epimerase family protein n=1 Tax=Paenibacillus sp. J2TS4 TaxID=2807194 RepID=UPI001B0B57BD|nr:sugar phosphate isomerase/epimerase [Paenibacillus sp. J2TS4]GIP35013.1 sugar phosphate isomerase [Paenibacillus sp. J2TS4]
MKHKFAAQLMTVHKETEQDFPGVLRDLKAMGWPAVQISGLRGWPAADIAAALRETGLATAGFHVLLDRLRDELDTVLAEARMFRTNDIICPYMPQEYQNPEGYRRMRCELNDIARKIGEQGFRFSYHHHAFEFATEVDGVTALEYLLEPAADNAILAEIDTYWVKKGGKDPLEFIRRYSNRMPIIHLKDMTTDGREETAEIGTGSIDFEPILLWGEQNGVEWYAVEQDRCPGNPMDSLQLSLDHLNKLADRLSGK